MQNDATDTRLMRYLESYISPARQQRIKDTLELRTNFICLALEDIYQSHNSAAVIRTCECFGIQNIHIIENKYNFEKTKGVSMGSEKWLNLHRYNVKNTDNTVSCFNALKAKGYKIAATTLRPNAIPISELPLDQPVALAFGTELTGLSEVAHELADVYVHLPMFGFTQSLNISVCAALSLYDLRTRLNQSNINWKLSDSEKDIIKFEWLRKTIRASDKIIAEFKSKQA